MLRASLDRVIASRLPFAMCRGQNLQSWSTMPHLSLLIAARSLRVTPKAPGHSGMTTPTAAHDFSFVVCFEVRVLPIKMHLIVISMIRHAVGRLTTHSSRGARFLISDLNPSLLHHRVLLHGTRRNGSRTCLVQLFLLSNLLIYLMFWLC